MDSPHTARHYASDCDEGDYRENAFGMGTFLPLFAEEIKLAVAKQFAEKVVHRIPLAGRGYNSASLPAPLLWNPRTDVAGLILPARRLRKCHE